MPKKNIQIYAMCQNRTPKHQKNVIIEIGDLMFKENFVTNLKRARINSGLTQEEVAEKINTSRTNITKYENGSLEPNLETIGQLAELYKVSTDWLFGIIKHN